MHQDKKCIGEVSTGGVDNSVGKVEEPHRPVDDCEANRDQGIDAACDDTV